MAKKVTIMDIAKETGYSIATVSRVLNKKGKYSKEAEEAITAAAQKRRYLPDYAAQELRSRSSRMIAVIIPDMEIRYYGLLAQRIQHNLLLKDYYPIYLSLGTEDLTNDRIFSLLRSMNICGLVCISCVLDAELLKELSVPTVYVNRIFSGEEMVHSLRYSSIRPDYRQAGYLAAEELSKKGCKKVGILRGIKKNNFSVRYQGFIEFVHYFGMEYVETEDVESVDLMQTGYREAELNYRRHPDLDGLFCDTDLVAMGAMAYYREKGIPIPEKLQLIAYGGLNRDLQFYYRMTSIIIPVDSIAQETAVMILELINGREGDPREITLQMRLLQGDTTKK